MSEITVVPHVLTYDLLLTARSAVSHHDPAVQDESNRSLFNRQKQLWHAPAATAPLHQAQVDAVCAANPVPEDAADLLSDLSFPEFVACALTRLFIDIYNRRNAGEGEGLFKGASRYGMLEPRLRQAAVRSHSLRGWWNRLCDDLCVGIHETSYDRHLLGLLALPRGLQQRVLEALAREYRSVVAIARAWAQARKLQIPEYAEKAGQGVGGADVTLSWEADAADARAGGVQVIEVPAVSANSLRHQVLREPAWQHLCQALDLNPAAPGQGPVPSGVEAIFYNGGNIAQGAKQPSNPFGMAQAIRAAYPSLDLLGGVTDSFDLGESHVHVDAWLVCRENADALADTPAEDLPALSVSAYDLLDDVTLTRQGGSKALGQMIFGGEALCQGTQILCRMQVAPFCPALAHGALVAASEWFLENGPSIGGQAARGFGWVAGEWLETPLEIDLEGLRREYEEYLAGNRERLRAWLVDGSLGTGAAVLS